MIALYLALGAAFGFVISWQSDWFRARARMRRELARLRAHAHQEVAHWQEAAARANAEAARVAREAKAYQAGCAHGREDVLSMMPLLAAAQQGPAGEARTGGDQH